MAGGGLGDSGFTQRKKKPTEETGEGTVSAHFFGKGPD